MGDATLTSRPYVHCTRLIDAFVTATATDGYIHLFSRFVAKEREHVMKEYEKLTPTVSFLANGADVMCMPDFKNKAVHMT